MQAKFKQPKSGDNRARKWRQSSQKVVYRYQRRFEPGHLGVEEVIIGPKRRHIALPRHQRRLQAVVRVVVSAVVRTVVRAVARVSPCQADARFAGGMSDPRCGPWGSTRGQSGPLAHGHSTRPQHGQDPDPSGGGAGAHMHRRQLQDELVVLRLQLGLPLCKHRELDGAGLTAKCKISTNFFSFWGVFLYVVERVQSFKGGARAVRTCARKSGSDQPKWRKTMLKATHLFLECAHRAGDVNWA